MKKVFNPTNNSAMPFFHWRGIGLCMLFNVIDGLDAMAMAFTGSSVSLEWSLDRSQLGVLLCSSLIGIACGSICAGPAGDRYGRRPVLLAGLWLSGISMLLSFLSESVGMLMCLRVLTGIGVGAVLVGANVMTYEYASQTKRSLAIAMQSLAFALGASLGGLLAHALNETIGWRYVFLVAGFITLAGALVGTHLLHESPQFVAPERERSENRLIAACLLLNPCNAQYSELFALGQWQRTISLGLVFLLTMFCFYFVMSWAPTLMIHDGFSEKEGATSGILLNLGGMVGALLIGLGANRFGCRRLLLGSLLLNAFLMTIMVPATRIAELAIPAGLTTGLLLYGAIAALFILAPQTFLTSRRTTGVGFVLAMGRIGAIISPVVAGLLLDAEWTTQNLFTFVASSQLLAALLVWRNCKET